MPWYKCFVHGKDFPGRLADEQGTVGFYTTQFIEANSPQEVEELGMKALKENPKLQLELITQEDARAMVYYEEILEIAKADVPKTQGGFVWYKEDGSTHETKIFANKHVFLSFLAFYAACFVVQTLGGLITQQSVMSWYPTLTKSALTPPGYVFGIAWTMLYILMALAASRIYAIRGTLRSRSLVWWGIQLVLGLLWSIVFFGQQQVALGFVIILLNWAAVAFVTRRFWRIEKRAGALMLPLLLWVSFASYLNGFIVLHP